MTLQVKYEGSIGYVPAIRTGLTSLVLAIQKLTASSPGEAARRCQEVWLKLQNTNLVIAAACTEIEADISRHQNDLFISQKLCSGLHERLKIERNKKHGLVAEKARLKEEKRHLEERQISLTRDVQGLRNKINHNEIGIGTLAVIGTAATVTAIAAAPFSGGVSLLALGATSCTGIGLVAFGREHHKLEKKKKNIANQINEIERSIQNINNQIQNQSGLISNLEKSLKDIKNNIFRIDSKSKLLGKNLTVIQNARLSLKGIERSCKSLQGDIGFIRDLIQAGSINGAEITDLIRNALNIERYAALLALN